MRPKELPCGGARERWVSGRNGSTGSRGSDAACPQYLSRGLQRGPYHLIHVVVAVLGETPHEGYALLSRSEGPVPPVKGLVFRARDRVVGGFFASRGLASNGRAAGRRAGGARSRR